MLTTELLLRQRWLDSSRYLDVSNISCHLLQTRRTSADLTKKKSSLHGTVQELLLNVNFCTSNASKSPPLVFSICWPFRGFPTWCWVEMTSCHDRLARFTEALKLEMARKAGTFWGIAWVLSFGTFRGQSHPSCFFWGSNWMRFWWSFEAASEEELLRLQDEECRA